MSYGPIEGGIHPDHKEVIPLAPEPIIKQDGQSKNDCERNAGKRFLGKLRKDHPHVPLIITKDALSSNAPHIREAEKNNLSVVFVMLMMLAFLVDQTQQICCPLFQGVWDKVGSKRALWDRMRSLFREFSFKSMRMLYEALLYGIKFQPPIILYDTS